ncbi:hypothetical protein [Dactylosporangium salmoneum]|uniref:Uncharacterized protein n=1 Tax=Dactylosporangium salmoneum TaxID=53361 RepID=A0ABP5TP90_9ACTN
MLYVAEAGDDLPGWDEDFDIPMGELLYIGTNGAAMQYFASPACGPDEVLMLLGGDLDPYPFGEEFDGLLIRPLR